VNVNTIAGYINGTKRNQIQTLTLASTVETALPLTTDTGTTSAILAVPQQTAILGSSNGLGPNGNAAILVPPYGVGNNIPDGVNAPYFNSSSFDLGRPFTIKLIGTGSAAANAGNTLTIKIYQGTSATLGSNTLFATPMSAIATASAANLRFYLSLTCFWDSTTQILTAQQSGSYLYNGTNTLISATAVTALTGVTTSSALSFVPSVTWGNAVGGVISVSEFSLEQN
jgi:hypothetical protein